LLPNKPVFEGVDAGVVLSAFVALLKENPVVPEVAGVDEAPPKDSPPVVGFADVLPPSAAVVLPSAPGAPKVNPLGLLSLLLLFAAPPKRLLPLEPPPKGRPDIVSLALAVVIR